MLSIAPGMDDIVFIGGKREYSTFYGFGGGEPFGGDGMIGSNVKMGGPKQKGGH
jgi:hypothetical protein